MPKMLAAFLFCMVAARFLVCQLNWGVTLYSGTNTSWLYEKKTYVGRKEKAEGPGKGLLY